jgi:hypothetical protein
MNVPRPSRLVRLSPESHPDGTGPDRGTDAVTAYPERGSNPHVSKRHEILSFLPVDAAPLPTKLHRDETGTSSTADRTESDPNAGAWSPEASPDLMRRIRARVAFSPTGCWVWQGAKNSRGYGQIGVRINGKTTSKSVHRLVAALTYGPIPTGGMACHTCDVRACCNPAHLYIGDVLTNAADRRERNPFVNVQATRNAAKTHCANGHPYSEENTVRRSCGDRICRICRAEQNRRSDAKRAAARKQAAA